MPTTITIDELDSLNEPAALYCWYPEQTDQQPAFINLDCRAGHVWAAYSSAIGNSWPMSVHHSLQLRWKIPVFRSVYANKLMTALAPKLQEIVDGFEEYWDGSNHVGRFTDDAYAAIAQLEKTISDGFDDTDLVSVYTPDEWLADVVLDGSEDNDYLHDLADDERAALGSGDVVHGSLYDYLVWMRDQAALVEATKGADIANATTD